LLIITADGSFGVYSMLPSLKVIYKGTIMPAMTHMALSAFGSPGRGLPKLSRIQLTETGRLLLLLSFESTSTGSNAISNAPGRTAATRTGWTGIESVGGSLQAFVYDQDSELWMRVSDGRFVLSDFYTSLPSKAAPKGELSRLDNALRMGSLQSQLKASQRGRLTGANGEGAAIYNQVEDSTSFVATKSHCEDRMACALALWSGEEFKHWLSLYVRVLAIAGHESLIRMLVDMLLGSTHHNEGQTGMINDNRSTWWMSSAPDILGFERSVIIQSLVIPELRKNRSLQRLTNEVNLSCLSQVPK
jgi:protein HIRA/HIR1